MPYSKLIIRKTQVFSTRSYVYLNSYTQIRDRGGTMCPPPGQIGLMHTSRCPHYSEAKLILSLRHKDVGSCLAIGGAGLRMLSPSGPQAMPSVSRPKCCYSSTVMPSFVGMVPKMIYQRACMRCLECSNQCWRQSRWLWFTLTNKPTSAQNET